ncbi:bis(5'-nucleosyl)-tetraphosphatase PrpE [asymmetrical] [Aplysia californica]|uniref:Bis(5'-nucleosyl)-tetraphosphatase PrpE [asymmetrical] n=1 Tax=Aplysia californica TaxID=6500 RepID=A0ABM0ZYB6_APLCA|nr:bis(5'-nucleosyl)-tetraphosphatase PrpE [asymmetrical] [Aplysia californica]
MAAVTFNSISLLQEFYSWLFPPPNIPKYGVPLPPEPHRVIDAQEVGDRPFLIVGDIHACCDEFKDLVTEAKRRAGFEDIFIVCVGDMLNKGPKNQETIQFLRDLSAKGQLAAVRGNHEESILREYMSKTRDKEYSLPERYQYLNDFSEEDFDFLLKLPYTLRIPKINALVVHAGVVPNVDLARQKYIDLSHMRNLIYSYHVWGSSVRGNSKCDIGVGWATMWSGPQHVYFGHDARRSVQDLPHATGLDSGCLYGKQLTGVIIDASLRRQFVSVDAKQVYSPP